MLSLKPLLATIVRKWCKIRGFRSDGLFLGGMRANRHSGGRYLHEIGIVLTSNMRDRVLSVYGVSGVLVIWIEAA